MSKRKQQKSPADALFDEVKDAIGDFGNIKRLSDISDVSAPCLYSWMDGRVQSPRMVTLLKVANALGLEIVVQR